MSDSVGDGKTIGGLTAAESVSGSDLVPITQGYTVPGTGQSRKATVDEIRGHTSERTVAVSESGVLDDAMVLQVMFCQAGTLTSTGAVGRVGTNPGATNTLTLDTVNSGTITSHGTISISSGGAVSFPAFSQAMAVGDALVITNQATADATGADYAFGLPFTTS